MLGNTRLLQPWDDGGPVLAESMYRVCVLKCVSTGAPHILFLTYKEFFLLVNPILLPNTRLPLPRNPLLLAARQYGEVADEPVLGKERLQRAFRPERLPLMFYRFPAVLLRYVVFDGFQAAREAGRAERTREPVVALQPRDRATGWLWQLDLMWLRKVVRGEEVEEAAELLAVYSMGAALRWRF